MYHFYKFMSGFAKFFSNALFILSIPVSIILCGLGWCLFFIKDIVIKITNEPDIFDLAIDGSNASMVNAINIIQWVGLGLAILMIVIFVILLTAWILKKILFKRIAGNYITRNKEWRNRDINRVLERLEDYRYRD